MALDTLPHVLIVGFTYQISVEHESFAKVVEDLINQYTLGFEPQRDLRDHQIGYFFGLNASLTCFSMLL